MQQPTSLTLRLTLLFGIVAAVVFSSFGWIIEHSIERHFRNDDTAELNVIADTVAQRLSVQSVADNNLSLEQRFSDILVGHHGASLYVTREDGRVVFASPGGPGLSNISDTALRNNKNVSVRRWNDADHAYRVLSRRVAENVSKDQRSYSISVAVAIDSHLRFLNSFRRTLWLMIVSGILVTGLFGWIAVRKGHAPLHSIVAQIRRISANELNTRLTPETLPKELTDLAVSFNEMLERMEEAFHRLANFSDDIAHELRTPVTNLLTQTQVALSQTRTTDEYREILYSNIEEYERMAQMIGDMLFLAKADNGQYQLSKDVIDLNKEIQELFDYYEAWAEEQGVSLVLKGSALIAGDRFMIRRVLSNLLSNAIRHTHSGNTVNVILDMETQHTASICVENPGPVIPAEHIPRLFDRFYRVDVSRQRGVDGAGLGLAIAKSIVDIHGGNIKVTSANNKTQFKILLPNEVE